jgi:beta-lactamase regulating signal transducer with metallopeptidase domain
MKMSLILCVGLLVARCLRHKSAALRHWVLAASIFCAGAAPIIEWFVPAWSPPALSGQTGSISTDVAFAIPSVSLTSTDRAGFNPESLIATISNAGTVVCLLMLIAGLGRLGWLTSRSVCVDDPRWTTLLGRVRLRQSDHPALLVTWGILRPTIIVPRTSREWSERRMRIVLWHELAHIERGDWIVHMLGELLRSIYWFNPLVWIACRKLRSESEQSCDDDVLTHGVEGTEYASELLELARELRRRKLWLPAPAMARPSGLERRVRAMLNANVDRQPVSRRVRAAIVLGLLGFSLPIAAAQNSFATFTGTLVDPTAGPLPAATLVLANPERDSKYEVRSNAAGTFEFVGLPAGTYELEIKLAGFAPVHEKLSLTAGQTLQRRYELHIGSLEETITVTDGPPRRIEGSTARPLTFIPFDASNCVATAVGGNIRPPKKLKDTAPIYPAGLRDSATEGVVVMDATIGLDGYLKSIEIRDGANPEFAAAALTAVREWQFSQTVLNCSPIEVAIKITTRFAHKP